MADLISRAAAIKEIEPIRYCGDFISALIHLPAVDAAPVVHARWQGVSPLVDSEECSHCRYNIPSDEFETPYCPWYGARMDGGRRDENA